MSQYEEWIGVDLDGTLAVKTDTFDPMVIGDPVPLMVEHVRSYLRVGKKVKIMTARAYNATPEVIANIQAWATTNIGTYYGRPLEVTCVKDPGMVALFDDRGYHVQENTGIVT